MDGEERECDVLIVGARVAGSILATLLGRGGWSALVVDRATFPSATLSTHFFRGSGCAEALSTIGLLSDVLETGAPQLVREYNADALTGTLTIDPPQDPGAVGSLADDELAYVFPSDAGTACVAVSVDLSRYAQMRHHPDIAFAERVMTHPFIAPRLRAGEWIGRLWGCGPRSSLVRVPAGPGWALVGDASMYQDPRAGLGMDNAAKQAMFLAEAIDDLLAGRMSEGEALRTYRQRRDEDQLPGFRETAQFGANLNAFRTA